MFCVLTVFCCDRFLTRQFFERNYNMTQRLDVLEILALSARELSSFGEEVLSREEREKAEAEAQQVVMDRVTQDGKPPSALDIVALRIKQNTRRFSRKSTVKPKKAAPNHFVPVAGHFFFPLLNQYDRPRLSFDLLGEDAVLLERFVQTLAIVLYSAGNAPQFVQLSRAFWDFTFAIRLHVTSGTRRQLLFGLLMIVTFAPWDKLRAEFSNDLVETHAWLVGVFHDDPDAECRSMAAQVTNTIVDVFKEGNSGLFELAGE